MEYVNWLSIIIATVASFLLGYFWYGSFLFGKPWKREANMTDDALQSGNTLKIFAISLLMTFVYSYLLAKIMIMTDFSGMADGLKLGFMIGVCFSAMSLGVNYQFSRRSTALYLIDAGFMIVSSTVMGTILGAMGN